MLQAILRFCSLEETLVVDAMAALARRRAARMDVEERTKQGAWGVLSDRLLEDPPGDFTRTTDIIVSFFAEYLFDGRFLLQFVVTTRGLGFIRLLRLLSCDNLLIFIFIYVFILFRFFYPRDF